MKKLYILLLLLSLFGYAKSQESEPCSTQYSDAGYYRYTASGRQRIINGDHSRAINESRRIARVTAESELAAIINSSITRVVDKMSLIDSQQLVGLARDTARFSSLQYFEGMNTICESEPQLVGNCYVVYVTKEISVNNVGNLFFKPSADGEKNDVNDEKKSSFIELLRDDNSSKSNKK